ncbi:MAG: RusA family crossover junction endodeoxyribonuclease [Patescibacteria group bacterium]|nr:RusA family crossover junction endodeoxyribonuclease [Patescibacteria group bacterium]
MPRKTDGNQINNRMPLWTFAFPTGANVNHLYVRTRSGVYLSDAAQAWRDEAILRVRQSGQTLPAGELVFGLWIYPPDGRRRDVDGLIKLTMDAVFAAFGDDDSRVACVSSMRMPRERPGKLTVRVWPLGEKEAIERD